MTELAKRVMNEPDFGETLPPPKRETNRNTYTRGVVENPKSVVDGEQL